VSWASWKGDGRIFHAIRVRELAPGRELEWWLARWFAVAVIGLNAIDMMFFIAAHRARRAGAPAASPAHRAAWPAGGLSVGRSS
jgi:hypothetical protein